MIVDANVLLFAQDESSPHHEPARRFLTEALNGTVRVGLPWPSLVAFLRFRTNPRAYALPLSSPEHRAIHAIEHGVAVCSADTDFARFTELRWINPLAL